MLFATALISVVPLFAVRWLPITDLPEHAAAMATLAHWADPAWRGPEHFYLALGRSQYLLYHLVGAGLTRVVGDAVLANRLLIAGAGLAAPFALRGLLRAVRRDERLAVLACPLFWSRPLVIGFLPFVVSVPVELATIALLVRQLEAFSRKRAVGLAVLGVVLFYLHINAFLQVGLIAAALVVTARPQRGLARHAAAHLAWLVPAALCALAWRMLGRLALAGDTLADSREVGYMSAVRALHAISLWAHDIWPSHVDEACGVVFWLAFAVLLSASVGRRQAPPPPWRFDPAYVVFLCGLTLYFALPFRIGVGTMLNVRMAATVAMLAVAALHSPAGGWRLHAPIAAAVAVTVVSAVDAIRVMRACQDEEMAGFETLLDRIPVGKRLLVLSFRRGSRHTLFPPWVHAGAYHRVWRGGVTSYSFSELSHWSLQYVPGHGPPKHSTFWDAEPCEFRNAEDGRYHDYLIVRGNLEVFRDRPPGPAWRTMASVHDFTLWEKTDEEYEPWGAPDRGPCVSRSVAEGY
jgi:hypothetical protein